MTGYVFCLTDTEMTKLGECGGYPYALKNKSRWKSFDFEESSIDCNITVVPLFVIDDIVYEVHHQYFIKESSSVTRLLVLKRCRVNCENIKDTDDDIKGVSEEKEAASETNPSEDTEMPE